MLRETCPPKKRTLGLVACLTFLISGCGGGGGGGGGGSSCGDEPDPIGVSVANLNQETHQGLANARTMLSETLACGNSSQHHDMARVLIAFVRIAWFLDIPSQGNASTLSGLLEDMAVSLDGQYLLDFIRDDNLNGPTKPVLNAGFPHVARFQDFLAEDLGAQVGLAAKELESVSGGFSAVLSGLFDVPGYELDYGDCQLVASGLRFLQAKLYLQAVLDLNADLYRIDSRAEAWLSAGEVGPQPYRLFCGLHPDLIVQDQQSTSGRDGFLNSADYLYSQGSFDTSAQAQNLLNGIRQALLSGIDDFKRGMQYVDDGNSGDDALYVDSDAQNTFELALPWIDNVRQAIAGGQPDIPDGSFWDWNGFVDLPGFVLEDSLVFGSATYSGRVFLPDYDGLPTTVATVDSFDHVQYSSLYQLHSDLTGEFLQDEDILDTWNAMNIAWDEGWVGWALEPAY